MLDRFIWKRMEGNVPVHKRYVESALADKAVL
jgi:hypothetical protein